MMINHKDIDNYESPFRFHDNTFEFNLIDFTIKREE